MPFFDAAPGRRLYYRTWGEGPVPVLLVMGLGLGYKSWGYQIDFLGREFGREFTVCAFDNVGVGRSSRPSLLTTTTAMAEDAVALATQALQWDSWHQVGISMGGMISLEVAKAVPERLRSLTLVCTHAGGPTSVAPVTGTINVLRALLLRDPQAFVSILFAPGTTLQTAGALLKDLGESYRAMHREECEGEGLEKHTVEVTPLGFVMQVSAIMRHHLSREELRAIGSHGFPVLTFGADSDALVRPVNAHVLQRDLRGQFKYFYNSGHVPIMERKEEFNHMLLEHLRRGEARWRGGAARWVQPARSRL